MKKNISPLREFSHSTAEPFTTTTNGTKKDVDIINDIPNVF